jgi:hypothetical protein
MRVDVEYAKHLRAELKKINAVPLDEIEWYENGKKLEIEKDLIEEWKFTGLNNVDFILID